MLGIGVISDVVNGKNRTVSLSIEKIGIIRGIKVIDGSIVYPNGSKFTNKLRERIANYIL